MVVVSAFPPWNKPVLANIERKWAGLKVLEVGAGKGHLAHELRRRGADVVTVDFVVPDVPGLHVGARSEHLPFADRTFDAVVSCSSLQYADSRNAFVEFHRVLKEDGFVLLNENGANNPVARVARIGRKMRSRTDRDAADYLATIKGHLNPHRQVFLPLSLRNWKGFYLLGPTHMLIGRHLGYEGRLARVVRRIDDLVLKALPWLRRWCWFHTIELHAGTDPKAQTIGAAVRDFKLQPGIKGAFRIWRLITTQRRFLEAAYGAWCFMFLRPAREVATAPPAATERLKRLFDSRLFTFEFSGRDGNRLLRGVFGADIVPDTARIRGSTILHAGEWSVVGEYGEGKRLFYADRHGRRVVSNFYDDETSVRHIHLVHRLSDDSFAVSTGDTAKYLDIWRLTDGRIEFVKRAAKRLAGYTAAVNIGEDHYFGSDFSGRPNYLFRLRDKQKFALPGGSYTHYVVNMESFGGRYILGVTKALPPLGGEKGAFIFDTRTENFLAL